MATGMNWNYRLLELAKHVADWSKDPSTKVGVVIADDNHRVLSVGYNGFPRDIEDSPERLNDREIKYSMIVHGEANALLNAARDVNGCSLYSTLFPCTECTKLIIQAGIKEVVYLRASPNLSCRWGEDWKISCHMLHEAGVEINELP